MNWKELWNNPVKIIDLVVSNNRLVLQLKLVKKRIERDISKEKRILRGFVFDAERLKKLTAELQSIDSELSIKVGELDPRKNITKNDILALFTERIDKIENTISSSEKMLKSILREEEETIGSANRIVASYLELIRAMKNGHAKQIENVELNEKYESELLAATKDGNLIKNLKYFEKEAEKYADRAKENKLLQEEIIEFMAKIKQLKLESEKVRDRFQDETEKIESIKEKVLSFLGLRRRELRERFA